MNRPQQPRPARRNISGILLLDKPVGLSSNRALQRAKGVFQAAKAGHTGSLDPAASGLLPVCFGEATKVCAYLLAADKTYAVSARFGEKRDTGDSEGSVVATGPVPELDAAAWRALLSGFLGPQEQVPPMYSALHHDGKRLYELARAGQEVERPARGIVIHDVSYDDYRDGTLYFSVRCSKGTYIRVLVEDIAARAGSVAYTSALRRTGFGPFSGFRLHTLEALAECADPMSLLLPPDSALSGLGEIRLNAEEVLRFSNGQRLRGQPVDEVETVRVYGPGGEFAGLATRSEEGEIRVSRLFHTSKNS